MVSVFNYTDYRKFLMDYYQEQKKLNKAFSYRFFARKAAISSVGLYKDVVDGRQSLGRTLILKFASGLELKSNEFEYFENMVYFNEAKNIEERKLYFERMIALCHSKTFIINPEQYEYYSKWYYSAVRAVISCYVIGDEDCEFIAKTLAPRIKAEQAKKALKVLLKLGLIAKNESGVYKQKETLVTTGVMEEDQRIASLNIINFQKSMLEIAAKTYDNHPFSLISMSTLTLSISEESFHWIKSEINELRERILNRVANDRNADRVYQMNYNFFPLVKLSETKKGTGKNSSV